MKILAIRGANLASLAREFEVDLARGALGGSGLFAIVGNTGAGKSTLLDALCVALFDRTPRIGERSRHAVLIGRGVDEASKVSAHDVRAILRRGAGRGFAEVDFQGDDGRRYRARWEVHRARDKAEGALQSQEMSLLSLDEESASLGGTKTETLAAIEERLGLSFDQFRRSALLAQGDFAAFLRADGKDRSELLERMTGTEIYSQLSMAAHKRGQAADQRIKDLGLSMTAIEVLADDALAQLRLELEGSSREHERAKRSLLEAERAAQWWQQRGRLGAELGEAERERDGALAAERAAAAWRQEHELRRRAEGLRPAWQAAQQAARAAAESEQQQLATAAAVERAASEAEAAQQARQRIDELLAPVREVREAIRLPAAPPRLVPGGKAGGGSGGAAGAVTLDQLAVRVGEPVAWLGERRHLHGLAAAWPEIQATEERDGQLRQAAAAIERTALRLRGDGERLVARRGQLEQERGRARTALDEATRRAAVANVPSSLDGKAVPSLEVASRQEDAARRSVAQATQLELALHAARAAAAAAIELRQRQAQCRAVIEEAEAALEGHEEAQRIERAALVEAEAALGRLAAAASLVHARAHLVAGDPCPLCGALEHPWAGRGAFDELIVEQEAAVAAVRARANAAAAAALERKLELTGARLTAANLLEEREEIAAQASTASAAWSTALTELGELALIADPSGEAADELVAEHATRARRALEKARDERRKIQALSNAAAEAASLLLTKRYDLEQVDDRLVALERERQELEEKIAGCGREVSALRAARVELAAQLATRLEAWSISREALEQEPARVFEELRLTVETWRKHADKLYEHEAALAWHLERSVAAAATAETQLTGARTSLQMIEAQRRQAQEAQRARQAELASACGEAGLGLGPDPGQLGGLMAAPPERLAQLAELLAELDRRLERARALLEERTRALAEHDRERPPSDAALAGDGPPTIEMILMLRQRAAAAEEQVLGLRARAERDLADRRRRQEMNAQVLAATSEGEVDRALAQAIGSHDGKLLRAFAQSLTLDTLLELANHHLDELAPRYQLERVPRYDLELQVIDRDMGDEVRAVQSLSGGESFLVSLALALALSSLAAGSVRVRTLLIDEGFGTLDPATLDSALAVLDALQATGRQVGIISHIPGLLERVGAHVKVIQRGSGRSDVVVVG